MQGPKFLTAEQLLLTTLVVKLVATAALATMLVRYRRFRHILIFERRAWPDRLTFALSLGIPLTAGVVARLLLGYDALDLTMEGSFLVGLIAGPYAGATVGAMVGMPPLFNGEWAALPFAVGCGFAGGGLRELCPKEAIWHFSPFIFPSVPRRAWKMVRSLEVDWQVVLLLAPVALELVAQALGFRWSDHHRLFVLAPNPPWSWSMLVVLLATVLCVATPIKIWNNARIEHRLQEQEKLLLAAKIEALANQINPHFLFNTLTSISSLIRTQPETARMLITKLSGPAPPPDAQHRSFRHAARGARIDRRVPGHRGGPLRPAAEGRQADRAADARRHRAEHDPAAAGRELDQARPGAQGRRRPHHDQDGRPRRPHDHRGPRRRARDDRGAAGARAGSTASA